MAVHLVKLACERPDRLGRSLSQWDCLELARQLEREGLVESISPETVRRILEHHKLKPWRHHLWLSPHTPHDALFSTRVAEVVDLHTRLLRADEIVLCMDEKTALQPRPRRQQVREWLASHPRFMLHFIPVHCSWLNQVEQGFSILQRKRLRIVDFASTADLQAKLMQFIAEWNEVAHPFNWTTKSVAKVMAEATPAAA